MRPKKQWVPFLCLSDLACYDGYINLVYGHRPTSRPYSVPVSDIWLGAREHYSPEKVHSLRLPIMDHTMCFKYGAK